MGFGGCIVVRLNERKRILEVVILCKMIMVMFVFSILKVGISVVVYFFFFVLCDFGV